ncbi:hypothetical protein [Methanosarcina lacustris]|uniref:hypothetical protein n=1 Tax=Methanosarcina lacustris TaxID=170861 RepID=UPI0012F6B06D|nr:hypothetical protein [Methanosarcina lacustris]
MNSFSRSDPKIPRIRAVLLLFTITSFLLMTAGSLYIDMYPDNPETGEFLVSTAGPVFWFFCSIWLLFNVATILNSRR